jgi:hypothetical protein
MTGKMPKQTISPKRYFWLVGGLTLVWIGLYIQSKPTWVQNIKEQLGLSPVLVANQDSFYNSRIDPIMEKYCAACHDDNKAKGQLRLDSFRQLTFSGKSGADLTLLDNNLLLERMSLPATDRLAMPPFGRERHNDAELALIKLWLTKGGSGTLTEEDFPEAPAKAKVIKFYDIDWQKIDEQRLAYKTQVEKLQEQYPHVLHYQARTSHLLVLDVFSMKSRFDDQVLEQFSQALAPVISELNLANSSISSHAVEHLLTMTNLTKLHTQGTQIQKSDVSQLAKLPTLETLVLDQALVDENIEALFAQQGIALIAVKQG